MNAFVISKLVYNFHYPRINCLPSCNQHINYILFNMRRMWALLFYIVNILNSPNYHKILVNRSLLVPASSNQPLSPLSTPTTTICLCRHIYNRIPTIKPNAFLSTQTYTSCTIALRPQLLYNIYRYVHFCRLYHINTRDRCCVLDKNN